MPDLFVPVVVLPPLIRTPLRPIAPRLPKEPATAPATLLRLDMHLAALSRAGVNDLSTLGTLTLRGAVMPVPGVTRPQRAPVPGGPVIPVIPAVLTMFSNVRAATGEGTILGPAGGPLLARRLKDDID